MGSLCEEMITAAAKIVATRDKELMDDIVTMEEEINQKERDIERICMKPVSYTHLDVYKRQQQLSWRLKSSQVSKINQKLEQNNGKTKVTGNLKNWLQQAIKISQDSYADGRNTCLLYTSRCV